MNWAAVSAISGMLAAVAVVLSVVYLAVQVRRSTLATYSQTHYLTTAALAETAATIASSGELSLNTSVCWSQNSESHNAVGFEKGSVLLSYSSEHGGRSDAQWIALTLVDGTSELGWSSRKGAPFPHEFLFELAQPYKITTLGFDTRKAEDEKFPGISARRVRVFASSAGRGGPFVEILSQEIAARDFTKIALDTPVEARWLRLSITRNWGNPEYTVLMEFSALGEPAGPPRRPRVASGTYATNWNLFYLRVKEGRLDGCYDHDGGVFEGHSNGDFLNIEWREVEPAQIGKAVLAITEDGSYFNGFWYEKGQLKGTWYGPKTQTQQEPSCAKKLRASQTSRLEETLDVTGRAVLYGIYFDYNSAVLKPESVKTLIEVKSWLIDNPSKAVTFEGHTDSDGSNAYNRELSQRRARAVAKWIADNGVSSSRLDAAGFGETRPVAGNNSPHGKALNRRVEIRVTN